MSNYIKSKNGRWIDKRRRAAMRLIVELAVCKISLLWRYPEYFVRLSWNDYQKAEMYNLMFFYGTQIAWRYYRIEGDLK